MSESQVAAPVNIDSSNQSFSFQPTFDKITTLDSAVNKTRLGGGLVGKISILVLGANLTAGAAACLLAHGSPVLATIIAVTTLVLNIVTVNRLVSFAERHPDTAVMDAAEIIIYKQQQKMDVLEPVDEVQPVTYLEL